MIWRSSGRTGSRVRPVKIAVVGAGAMGSVYAGLLASAGHEVWAIDRREDLVEAIRDRGLRVEGASGDRTVRIDATTDPADAGEAELVVLATKAMDATAAAESARPLVGPATLVLSIQNGLGGPDAAAAVLGDDRVAVGVVGGFGASVVAPGHVHHHGMELVRLGERSGPVTPRIETVADVWRQAGFTVRTYDDVDRLVWEKLVCNVAFSGTCSVLGRTIGDVIADEHAWSVASQCAVEAYEVARALEIELGFDDPVAYVRAFGLAMPGAKPSMLLDLEAGRPTEVDFINGAIPRAGVGVGVVAPFNEAVSALVRALELGTSTPCWKSSALPWAPTAYAETGPSGRLRFPRDGGGIGRGRRVAARRANGRPADPAGGDIAPAGRAGRAGRYARRLRRSGLPPDARHLRRTGRADRDADLRRRPTRGDRLGACSRSAAGLERRGRGRVPPGRRPGGGAALMHNRWHPDLEPIAEIAPVRRSGSRPRTASTASSPARARTPTPAHSTSGSVIR